MGILSCMTFDTPSCSGRHEVITYHDITKASKNLAEIRMCFPMGNMITAEGVDRLTGGEFATFDL